jgi:hypothetical protein
MVWSHHYSTYTIKEMVNSAITVNNIEKVKGYFLYISVVMSSTQANQFNFTMLKIVSDNLQKP